MAVKRNPKPLNILISPSLGHAKGIKTLGDKGHNVVVMGTPEVLAHPWDFWDIIFSEKAWRMNEELAETAGLPQIAVTASRAVKFKRKKKTEELDENED